MPTYRFNVYNKEMIYDPKGVQFDTFEEAHDAALQILCGSLLAKDVDLIAGCSWMLDITDDAGLILQTLNLTSWNSPARVAAISQNDLKHFGLNVAPLI